MEKMLTINNCKTGKGARFTWRKHVRGSSGRLFFSSVTSSTLRPAREPGWTSSRSTARSFYLGRCLASSAKTRYCLGGFWMVFHFNILLAFIGWLVSLVLFCLFLRSYFACFLSTAISLCWRGQYINQRIK